MTDLVNVFFQEQVGDEA